MAAARRPSTRKLEQPYILALKKLCENERHPFESSVWETLLSAPVPKLATINETLDLQALSNDLSTTMNANNPSSQNFNLLLLFLISGLKGFRIKAYDVEIPTETFNSMFAFTIVVRQMIKTRERVELQQIFELDREHHSPAAIVDLKRSTSNGKILQIDHFVINDKRTRSSVLLEELIQFIIYGKTDTFLQYQSYVEALNLLFTLLSSQLEKEPIGNSWSDLFWDLLLCQMPHFAKGLMSRLLDNYLQQQEFPPEASSGILMSAYSLLVGKVNELDAPFLIADNSLKLVLLLSSQHFDDLSLPFRDAISQFGEEAVDQEEQSFILINDHATQMDSFRLIYDQISISLEEREDALILLYLLLMRNNTFRIYFLSRTDPEGILLSLLKIAHLVTEEKKHFSFIYLVFDIFVILSLDEAYIKNTQQIGIQSPTWYSERMLRKVTLGGLMLLVVMRSISYNISKLHSAHLHTTSLAILCNVAPSIFQIETVVASRVISLLEQVSKRFHKTVLDEAGGEISEVLIVCSDVIAGLLEVINSIISHSLRDNSHLSYTLLDRQELFQQLSEYERFSSLSGNVLIAIDYFNSRISDAEIEVPTVDLLLGLIETANQTWNTNKIKILPTVKFHAEEDSEAFKFLLPLAWSFLAENSDLVHGEEAIFFQRT